MKILSQHHRNNANHCCKKTAWERQPVFFVTQRKAAPLTRWVHSLLNCAEEKVERGHSQQDDFCPVFFLVWQVRHATGCLLLCTCPDPCKTLSASPFIHILSHRNPHFLPSPFIHILSNGNPHFLPSPFIHILSHGNPHFLPSPFIHILIHGNPHFLPSPFIHILSHRNPHFLPSPFIHKPSHGNPHFLPSPFIHILSHGNPHFLPSPNLFVNFEQFKVNKVVNAAEVVNICVCTVALSVHKLAPDYKRITFKLYWNLSIYRNASILSYAEVNLAVIT